MYSVLVGAGWAVPGSSQIELWYLALEEKLKIVGVGTPGSVG